MIEKKKYRSPAIPRILLKLLSVYHERHSILEDFEETFAEVMHSRGSFEAKLWY